MAGAWTMYGPGSYTSPLFGIYTPITEITGQTVLNHQGTVCEQFEMNFYRCLEAFGVIASKRKCDLEYRDMMECIFQRKQMGRFHAMRKERLKQFLEGKLDRPWGINPSGVWYEAFGDFYAHQPYKGSRTYN